MSRLYFVFLLLMPLAATASAPAPVRVDPSTEAEVQDVVFFTESRPYLIRLRIRLDEKDFAKAWEAQLDRLFAWFDHDGDGALDKNEVGKAPHPATLAVWLMGNLYGQANVNPASFVEMDIDKDGQISVAEFRAYYRLNGAGPVRVQPGYTNPMGGDVVTEQLFMALGGNKDAKLSRQQLSKLDDALLRLDLNDDEMIAPAELFPGGAFAPTFNRLRVAQPTGWNNGVPPGLPPMLVEKETGSKQLTQRYKAAKAVLTRYDKDQNGKLSREEIGFPNNLFDRLDDNKDGQLETAELLRWIIVHPDMESIVRLGKSDPKSPLVELTKPKNSAEGTKNPRLASFAFHEGLLNLSRADGQQVSITNFTPFLTQTFKMLDKNQKGFVTAKQIAEQPQFSYLKALFQAADRDGDDRLTEKELKAWLDLMGQVQGCVVSIGFTQNGRGLFEILDADGDGRLSVREMRNAWSRLAEFDRDKDGAIARTEIPLQFQMTISLGYPIQGAFTSGGAPAIRGMGVPANVPATSRGPIWFRKMDTIGDGDISRREFLGSAEDFRQLDTDGDGLISLEEAEKADASLKSKTAKK